MTSVLFFFFNDTATTEIYTLSLHDALPIWPWMTEGEVRQTTRPARGVDRGRGPHHHPARPGPPAPTAGRPRREVDALDRKSTRLNSSHANISYAVFCLKKKKTIEHTQTNIV